MTGFNHGMTGAVIALAVRQPLLAVPLAFVSHYVTDMLPHFGFEQKEVLKKRFDFFVLGDFVFSLILMFVLAILFPAQAILIWLCMIAAAIPDMVWWFYRGSVASWPRGLGDFSAWHFKINTESHVRHFYYDILWFAAMWALVIYRLLV